MNRTGVPMPVHEERRLWGASAAVALGAHVGVAALILAWARPVEAPVEEPVVLVELPADAAPAPSAATSVEQSVETKPQPEPVDPVQRTPPIEVPQVRAPLPKDAVVLPPPAPVRPQPVVSAAASAPVINAAPPEPKADTGSGSGKVAGGDPKARKAEADYFAMVAAHLNRKKIYPVEAKKARQQGIVTVRFTVDRDGGVSGAFIKKSSGFAVLDEATIKLLYLVAPLPRMPSSMQRDSVTIAVPIDYSLRTS